MSQEHLDEIARQELDFMLTEMTARLEDMHPEVAEALKALRDGQVDEPEGLRMLVLAVGKHGLYSAVEKAALDVFQPDEVPMVIEPDGRLPRLNPLVEAAIAERIQYDGDAPELRTGSMPEGARPAVPVRNPSRDPVALGEQLDRASEMVACEITEARQGHVRQIEAKIEELGLDPESEAALALYQDHLPAIPTGVPGYQPGSLPEPRKVDSPTGSALAALTPQERQQKAWKALSTTQGRRSALQVIEELVLAGLRSEGLDLKARVPTRGPADVKAYAEWKVRLSGPEAMQTSFSFMDAAAKGLLRSLTEGLEGVELHNPVLELTAINTVDVRQVGWAARIVES